MSDQGSEELEVDISNLDITDEMIAERSVLDLNNLPDDMSLWMQKTIRFIDTLNMQVGKIASLLLIPAAVAMVYEVVARKVFIAPTAWAFDVSRMTIGAMFMLGAGYGLMRGIHIRADFIYRNWQPKTQALVDLVLYLLFFFPGMVMFFYISFDYTYDAWVRWELTMDTAWMAPLAPARTAMPLGALFLILQGISECVKSLYAVQNNRWA
ncbi:MAG: TRAP transporter small permease subunit [Chloroflexota bacterium]